ncbi:hypothetical protein B0O99DRAFT_682559 [Bisporella sp. PMI_857]|nr:hypothetical protein B0O99DRAFT_682559 [Bisporella sp. PMI_857]
MTAFKVASALVFGVATAAYGVSVLTKPYTSRHRGTWYNSEPRPQQDRWDTNMDRTQIKRDVERRKPWNMSAADKARLERAIEES